MSAAASRSLLRSTVGAVRRDATLCVVSGLTWQTVAVAVPWVLERAVDDGVVGGSGQALWAWSAVLVGLGVLRGAGDAARHWWVERAGARAADHLRRRLVDRLLAMDDDEAARFGHGDLIARAVSDTATVQNWVAGIATFATAAFTLAAVLVLLVTLDPALVLIGLATVPLAAGFALCQVKTHGRAAARRAAATGAYASAVEPAIAGARAIKGLGAEAVVVARAGEAGGHLRAAALGLARVEAWWLAAAAAIPAAGITAGLWVGGTKVLDGDLSVGALVAFAAWMGLLVDATETLTERLADRGAALAAAGRLAEVLGDRGGDPEAGAARAAHREQSSPATSTAGGRGLDVALDGVAARRGGPRVLEGVDLDVAAGEWLAVVGPTGSGKSTLLRVVAGLDRAAAGHVLIGGRDLSTMAAGDRRRLVVMVPQNASLLSGTVAEVLRMGAPNASDDEVWAAVEAAGAATFVTALGGLDARVGERGLSLSGGQRQRLALAAAALRRPAVLCLDDATSALDPSTEATVLAALRAYLPATTVIAATHRSATAAACDRTVVVADGGLPCATLADLDALAPPAPGASR